jgi:hypothetical protein
MSNILPILAIVAAAIGATTFFSKSPSSLPSPAQAPVPYGGSKRRKTKKNRRR